MKIGIRTKLVYYIFLTIIITFIIFGKWFLSNEKKHWEAYQLEQALTFTSFTSSEIVKFFGREIRTRKAKTNFDENVKALLQFNNDLIKFMILNINGATLYDSDFFEDYLTISERKEIDGLKMYLDPATLTSDEQSFEIVRLKNGRKIIEVITPIIHLTGRHILNIKYFISFNSVEKEYNAIKHDFYIMTLITLFLSLLLLIAISKKITNPVFVLTGKVKKMRSGDFNARVIKPTNDEIGELSLAFNEMVDAIKQDRENIEMKNKELLDANTELKELQEQLIKSEKLAAIGQLAAGVSHEIDNPIGIILGYAEYIKSELGDNRELQDEMDNIINESKRCRRIVGGLLNFSKTSPSFMEEIDLNDIAKETVSAVSLQSLFKRITIKEEYDHFIPVIMLDRDKMKQVIVNLLLNSAQAIKKEGEISVLTKLIKKGDRQFINLYITDSGFGIPKENIDKIFNPFFTTKSHGKGTGLGLSICQKLLEEQKGAIAVKSKVKSGTTFTITFPTQSS